MSAWKPKVLGRPTPSSTSSMARHECMPPQQISPSAASHSPSSSAMSQALVKVSMIMRVLPAGSLAQSATPPDESMRTTPEGRAPSSRRRRPMRHALRTCSSQWARCSASPKAQPLQTGATSEPMARPLSAAVSARRFRSSSVESISTCGAHRNRSMPSNLAPPTSASAVRPIICSRLMAGSGVPGPLPTTPGQVALCSFGKVLDMTLSFLK